MTNDTFRASTWRGGLCHLAADLRWIDHTARRSRNLAERPEAGIVVFGSLTPAGDAQAVCLTATAQEVAAGT